MKALTPQMFGAKCDGVHDDSAAWQAMGLACYGVEPNQQENLMEENPNKYFGLYCEQCGVWWAQPNNSGRLLFYPAPEIANAHLRDNGWFHRGPEHLWKVQEFGKEERVDPKNLPPNSELCLVGES